MDAGDASFAVDAPMADTGVVAFQSCTGDGGGMTNCGPGGSGTRSCCGSLIVHGGTFARSYDAVTYVDAGNPATVSDFDLDQYEITVGRFRQFVTAVVAGWLPPAGSGKHVHLNGGQGLASTAGGFETGWDPAWNSNLASSLTTWTSNLSCNGNNLSTWTQTSGGNDARPINCETWFEAYAFCIWDGGFLPSEAEWNYAAAGGGGSTGQRVYPWSAPPTSNLLDCTHANYSTGNTATECYVAGLPPPYVGSKSPAGDGVFGQADLVGNVNEWVLDWGDDYATPCSDCAATAPRTERIFRSGGWFEQQPVQPVSGRRSAPPSSRSLETGARCARPPS